MKKGRENMDMEKNKRIFMKPGETNEEDRRNFIKFWVKYMKSTSDKEWSKQQNVIINSQLHVAKYNFRL